MTKYYQQMLNFVEYSWFKFEFGALTRKNEVSDFSILQHHGELTETIFPSDLKQKLWLTKKAELGKST